MTSKAETIISRLKESVDYRQRREYVRQLGRINTIASLQGLIDCLDDTDEEVQQAAVTALRKLGRPEAIEPLLRPKILASPDPKVRWAAVFALGELGDQRVIEPLTRMLEDSEWVVRNQAAEAVRNRLTDLAERGGPEEIKLLIRMLVTDDREVHEHTVSLLVGLNIKAIETLIDALQVPSRHVRLGAIDALGRIGDKQATPALIQMTREQSSTVRRQAVVALGKLRDFDALETLINLLGDSQQTVAEATIDSIQSLGTKTTPILIERLRHVHKRSMRKNIISVLGRTTDPRAVLPLLNNLSSSYYLIRSAAAEALIQYGTKVIEQVTEHLMFSRVPIEPLIAEAEKQANKRLRLRAIRSIGELKNPLAIPALKKIVQEEDREISTEAAAALVVVGCCSWGRHMSAYMLGEIADSRSIKPLMKTLKDPSHHVRSAAIGALAKIGAVEATRALAQVLNKDPEPPVRREAAIALGKFGAGIKEAADALIRALSDKSRRVRAQAARAQGRLGDPKAVDPLIRALNDSYWSVRSNAFNSLVSLGPVALPGLIEAVETLSGETRLKVLEVITEMGQPGAIEPLQGMLKPAEKDKEFREKVKKTIETLKMKEEEQEEA